jgi:hypothetical protein
MLHQHAFDLERTDQMTGRLDHVVGAADEPEVAVRIAAGKVAAQVPAGAKALAVALLLAEVGAEHRRPAGRSASSPDVRFLDRLDFAVLADAARSRPRRPASVCPSSRA